MVRFPGKSGIIVFTAKYSGKIGSVVPGNWEQVTIFPGQPGIEINIEIFQTVQQAFS